MSEINTQIPYRARCAHQGPVCGGFKNKLAADKVDLYASSVSPAPLPTSGLTIGTDCYPCDSPTPLGVSGEDWGRYPEQWQGTLKDLLTVNTFVKGAVTDLGVCHKYGFKKYGGYREWPGCYGWDSNDSCAPPDRGTAADQTRFRTATYDIDYHSNEVGTGDIIYVDATATGSRTVNLNSCVLESSLVTTEDDYIYRAGYTDGDDVYHPGVPYDPKALVRHVSGGIGTEYLAVYPATDPPTDPFLVARAIKSGGVTVLDDVCANDPHCLAQMILPTNMGGGALADFLAAQGLPAITDPNSYDESIDNSTMYQTNTSAVSFSKSGGTLTFSVEWDYAPIPTTTPVTDEGHYSFSGTIILSDPVTAADIRTDIETNLISKWSLAGTEPWRTDPWSSIMPLTARRERGTQSPVGFNPGNVDDYRSPIADSNQNDPFTTDASPGQNGTAISDGTYPPNSAGWTPTYDGTPVSWIPTYDQMAWVDPTAWFFWWTPGTSQGDSAAADLKLVYDGTIIGGPKSPGTYGWFDFYYRDVRFCALVPSDACAGASFGSYLYQNGGRLSDAIVSLSSTALADGPQYSTFLPQNATHWTGNEWAHNIPSGAIIDSATVGAGIFIAKAAFTRLPVPSYNFGGPCGGGRVLIDEPTAKCITGESGGDVTLESAFDSVAGLTVLIAFAGSSDGIYTGCTQAGAVLTLGTKISDLPSDFSHPFSSSFSSVGGLAGIVRFPDAPALCGRQSVSITDNGDGTSNVLFADTQTNLRTGDALDFTNVVMTAVQTNIAVTRVDDLNFTVAVAFAAMAGTFYCTSHGATAWYWNDDTQKFQMRYGGWSNDYRPLTPTETFGGCQPLCLPLSKCHPQVVAFSPNGETWPQINTPDGLKATGKTFWFGADGLPGFTADGVFGARVQATVEFEVQNPLYQSPKSPCTDGVTIVEDDGTCLPPDPPKLYFAPHTRVEALCGVSDADGAGTDRTEVAPGLPTDAVNGLLTWPAMVQPGNPGVYGYSYTVTLEPWMRYSNELGSIEAGGCRWLNYYYAHTLGGDL